VVTEVVAVTTDTDGGVKSEGVVEDEPTTVSGYNCAEGEGDTVPAAAPYGAGLFREADVLGPLSRAGRRTKPCTLTCFAKLAIVRNLLPQQVQLTLMH